MTDQRTMEEQVVAQMQRYRLDVIEATNSLLYILYGINLVHRKAAGLPINTFVAPDYPALRVFPQVSKSSPFSERTAPGGPMEKLAFKTWIDEVYRVWEKVHRNKLREEFRKFIPRAINPQTDPLGDLRHVRNDLVHRSGIAESCAKCRVLRWFNRGDRIHMKVWHVLDFLNQMAWINHLPLHVEQDRVIMWLPSHRDTVPTESVPRLVSVRPLLYQPEEFRYRYCVSVVFEDAVSASIPIDTSHSHEITDRQWMDMRINESGDILIASESTIGARELYQHCFGPPIEGPGMFSPVMRFR